MVVLFLKRLILTPKLKILNKFKMSKIGLFYAPAKGSTEKIAKKIAEKIGNDKVELILIDKNTEIEKITSYDKIIFGISTVGRESWDAQYHKIGWDYVLPKLEKTSFKGKTAAVYGMGNHILYADYFVDAMGALGKAVLNNDGKLVGYVNKNEYEYKHSEAIIGDKFIGLPLDEDTQEELTEIRIDKWLADIKDDLGF